MIIRMFQLLIKSKMILQSLFKTDLVIFELVEKIIVKNKVKKNILFLFIS